ncbi:MAG: MarR family transcriptional regulator [Thermodesulfobacteriota bacterium]|nr:MarR family transcriptional regulator [Thermodesulfobacteriota bacterium]
MKGDDCIFFQLAKANQAAARYWSKKIGPLNVTAVQGMVLTFLSEEDRITSSHLGQRTQLDSATLTGILDRLEGVELVERRPNPEDRRAILIHLTQKGLNITDRIREEMERGNEEFLDVLTAEENSMLRRLLKRIRRQ